jgi:hypothetical protein
MKVRPAFFGNLFSSLFMHAVVLFLLLTVPIYSGSIHTEPYGYLRVSLNGAESGKASGVLQAAQEVTSGRVAKVGNPVERKPAGSPASTKESVPGHNEVKQASANAAGREKERQQRAFHSEGQAGAAKDVSGPTGRPVPSEEKSEQKNEAPVGGRESSPVITAKDGDEDEIEAMVRDLLKVPEAASAGRTAAHVSHDRGVTLAEKGSSEKAAVSSGKIPSASTAPAVKPPAPPVVAASSLPVPAQDIGKAGNKDRNPEPQAAPEKAPAMAVEKAGGTGEKAAPAVPGDAPIPENSGAPPDGIVHETAPDKGAQEKNVSPPPASVPVLPEPPVVAASSLPVPAQDIGKVGSKEKKPEPDTAPTTVSVEEEIRSAVTRIGETTYESAPETSAADKEKSRPRSIMPSAARAAGKVGNKERKPEPDTAPKTVSVEEEIHSAVTRIGETTYGSGQEIQGGGAKKNGPKVSSVKSSGESPTPSTLVLTVPAPSQPAIKLNPAGELLGGGPADGSGNGKLGLNTDARISGRDVVSENGAAGREQVRAMTPVAVKKGHGKTVIGFPMPDAFFLKDIKIQVALSGPEMPEISRRLLERPLADDTGSAPADNRAVAVKEEAEDIAIGGRVSTEKMFSVAKAGKGIYTFVMENKGGKPYEADVTFILYGGENNQRIKTYKDLSLLPGTAIRFRFMLPQAVFWDDEDRFTGSIEDSNYITKFDYNSGLIWKEKKDY